MLSDKDGGSDSSDCEDLFSDGHMLNLNFKPLNVGAIRDVVKILRRKLQVKKIMLMLTKILTMNRWGPRKN